MSLYCRFLGEQKLCAKYFGTKKMSRNFTTPVASEYRWRRDGPSRPRVLRGVNRSASKVAASTLHLSLSRSLGQRRSAWLYWAGRGTRRPGRGSRPAAAVAAEPQINTRYLISIRCRRPGERGPRRRRSSALRPAGENDVEARRRDRARLPGASEIILLMK